MKVPLQVYCVTAQMHLDYLISKPSLIAISYIHFALFGDGPSINTIKGIQEITRFLTMYFLFIIAWVFVYCAEHQSYFKLI